MRRRIAVALLAPLLVPLAACTPATAPASENAVADRTDDELLDTSPDSLAAPDDANSMPEPTNTER